MVEGVTMEALTGSSELDGAVIVTVIAVWVVQVSMDKVVDMVAVRDGGVTATRTVHVIVGVGTTSMTRSTVGGVLTPDLESMLIDMVAVRMVEMAIVQVVDVSIVSQRNMPTIGPVRVIVVGVHSAFIRGHDRRPR
jgi:hypothetical protein